VGLSEFESLPGSLSGQAALLSELMSTAIEPACRDAGITMGGFELLSAIKAAGNRASQAHIARRLGITPPSFTEALRGVVAAGLVEQAPHPRDSRSKVVRLTDKGSRALRKVLTAVNQAERILVEQVSHDELQLALSVLKRANRSLARALNR
jgi:MarR family transcriptional regulator, lower aerobic nicotinate degradation pathway regulator